MKSPILALLITVGAISTATAQDWSVRLRTAFISNLVTADIDPRCSLGRPSVSRPGSLEFAFYYPDTCILLNRAFLRQQKENLKRFTWSFIGKDTLLGYAFADFAFFDKHNTWQPLEMWREYYSPDYRDTLATPGQRLHALADVLPFETDVTISDTAIDVVLVEKPCFIPNYSLKAKSNGYTRKGYINFLAAIIHYYVLRQQMMVTNIHYFALSGEASDTRFDLATEYNRILPASE